MTTPVILVDGSAPPPLGLASAGYKAAGASPVLSLASVLGLSQCHWKLTSVPRGSACALGTPNPSLTTSPSSSNCTMGPLDKVGTYLGSVTTDNGVAVEFAVAVLTSGALIRIPALGETTQWDPSGYWQQSLYEALSNLSVGGAGGPMRFGLGGTLTDNFFIGNQVQNVATQPVSRTLAQAQRFTTIVIKHSNTLGIGVDITWTVYNRNNPTALVAANIGGNGGSFVLPAGVDFAALDTMCVKHHKNGATAAIDADIVVF